MESTENKKSQEDLICGYLRGELSPEEITELIKWIKNNKANKRYFDECSELWITSKANSGNSGYNAQEGFWKFKQKIKADDHSQSQHLKKIWLKKISGYAAAVIIAFSLGGFLFYQAGKKNIASSGQFINELEVPFGSSAQLLLSDGTVVNLNAGSTLKTDPNFGINARIVQLEGEGYFKVAKDSEKPFTVQTPYLNVKALGTEFNVKAYPVDKTVETTLINGSVIIEPVSDVNNGEITILKPNQKVTFYKGDSKIEKGSSAGQDKSTASIEPVKIDVAAASSRLVTENVNVETVVSWKENLWIFEQQNLFQIAVELERRFDIQIIFESEKLKSYRFTGKILAEPIEQVLEVISISAPINYKLKGKIVTLSENKDFNKINSDLFTQPD